MVIIGPLIDPEEGLVKKLENVTMKINEVQMQSGELYITEKYESDESRQSAFFLSLSLRHFT